MHSVGSLSDQSDKLRSVIDTTKLKKIDLLALSESCWPVTRVATICDTSILYSGTPSSHLHGVTIVLSPLARAAWDETGNVLKPVYECILRIRLKCHL